MSIMDGKYGLTTPSVGYKPFRYPWAYEMFRLQCQAHWLPGEATLGEDIKDWRSKLTGNERHLVNNLLRFFTQGDVDVNNNYMEKYSQVFKPTEVKMMLAQFSATETVHIDAYSLLNETVGMDEGEYSMFLELQPLRAKHDYLGQFTVRDERQVALTLAAFGGFAEGLQLFGTFAMLLNFPRRGLMKNMGQIVSWSLRDESLHCDGIIKLFKTWTQETGVMDASLRDGIFEVAETALKLEDAFIDYAFEMGPVNGMTAQETKSYVRFVADWRLVQLGLVNREARVFGSDPEHHPLPWLPALTHAKEYVNFFETRGTDYSKAATRGSWGEVWDAFDRRGAAPQH